MSTAGEQQKKQNKAIFMHKVRNDELSESMTSMFNSSNTQHLLLTIAGGTTFLHEPLSIKKTKKRKGMNEWKVHQVEFYGKISKQGFAVLISDREAAYCTKLQNT